MTGWKDQLHFYTHEDHKYFRSITRIKDAGKTTLKRKGNAAVRIEWDFTDHPIRITANDKACHSMSDMDWNRESCRRRETADACERVGLQEKAERNDRISCKDDPASVACENVRKHKQWLQERKEECRKIPILLICKKLAIVSRVRMRHDRPCDIAQDKADPAKLNSPGGNAIMFGLCGGIRDSPIGAGTGRSGWWNAFNCGYQAYRQKKAVDDNPYLNEGKKDGWNEGWQAAKKACSTGRRPFYPPKNQSDEDAVFGWGVRSMGIKGQK